MHDRVMFKRSHRSHSKVRILPATLAGARSRIPTQDLADAAYDTEAPTPTTDVLVILSTPRSGSTLLCDLLRTHEICIAHEYFQRYDYIPILADRWGCVRDDTLVEPAYVESLCKHRTLRNGWLGINVHGEHLDIFARALEHFGDARIHYVHLMRRDFIAQAVSYEIASQTLQWSSFFEKQRDARYSFEGIADKLRRIQEQTAISQAFLKTQRVHASALHYEDLVSQPASELARLSFLPRTDLAAESRLGRQSTDRNSEWIARFSEEYLSRALPTA